MELEKIKSSLLKIINPMTGRTLETDKAIDSINFENNTCVVSLKFIDPTDPLIYDLKKIIAKIVKLDFGIPSLKILIRKNEEKVLDNNKYIFFIGATSDNENSLKLLEAATYFQKQNKKIGIIDLNFEKPLIPYLLNCEDEEVTFIEDKIIPNLVNGFEIMSTSFFEDPNSAVIWQQQMILAMIDNMFYRVSFSSDIDLILVDLGSYANDKLKKCLEIVKNASVYITHADDKISKVFAKKKENAILLLDGKVIKNYKIKK